MYQALEDSLIIASKQAYPEFRTVAGYSGELDRENLATLLPSFPACYVVIEAAIIDQPENNLLQQAVTLSTLIGVASVRSRKDSRSAAFAAAKALINQLTGKNLDLDILPLTPTGFDLVLTDNSITVYGLRWSTSFDQTFGEN